MRMGGPWGPRATGAGTGQATVVATHGAACTVYCFILVIISNIGSFFPLFIQEYKKSLKYRYLEKWLIYPMNAAAKPSGDKVI